MKSYLDKAGLQDYTTKLHAKYLSIFATRSMVGTPLVASTAAEMTDTDKIYVYVGSESGYTSGNWYYYNGSAWATGGIYNSQGIVLDTALTSTTNPAQGKAVGDAVSALSDEIDDINSTLSPGTVDVGLEYTWTDDKYWSQGSHTTGNNENYSYATVTLGSSTSVSGHSNADPNGSIGADFIDANGTYIQGGSFRNTVTGSYLWDFEDVTVPEGAVYLKITCRKAYKDTFVITGKQPSIETRVDALEDSIGEIDINKLNGSDSASYQPSLIWQDNKYVKYSTGQIAELENYSVVSIDVSEATNVKGYTNLDPNGTVGACFYDENGAVIDDSLVRPTTAGTYNWNYDLSVPATAVSFAITCRSAYKSSFTCTVTGALESYDMRLTLLVEQDRSFEEDLATVMPDISWHGATTYTVLTNTQQRIYFDSICNTNIPGHYKVAVTGASYPEVTYTDDYVQFDVTTPKTVTVEISYLGIDTSVKSSFSVTVTAIDEIDYPAMKMMFIGDSLTQDGTMVKTVKDTIGANLTLYGTRGTAPYLNEGRSSWSSLEYCTLASKNSVANPFYDPDLEDFSFSYYMRSDGPQAAYRDVQYVNVLLGQNDGYILDRIQYITKIIDSIRAYNQNIIITVMGLFHLAKDNSGCGAYLQNTYEYSRKAKLWNDAVQTAVSAYASNVYFVPQFENLDSYYDFERSTRNASAENTEQVTYFTNNVHPQSYGYMHFANVLVAYLNQLAGT